MSLEEAFFVEQGFCNEESRKVKDMGIMGHSVAHRLLIRPEISKEEAAQFANQVFGLFTSRVKELESYDDRNFFIEGQFIDPSATEKEEMEGNLKSEKFVLKVMHSRDTYDNRVLDAIEAAMLHLKNTIGHRINLPVNLPTLNGESKVLVDVELTDNQLREHDAAFIDDIGKSTSDDDPYFHSIKNQDGNVIHTMKHYLRLLTYVPGEKFPGEEMSNNLFYEGGQLTARVINALEDFESPALIARQSIWDMKNLMSLNSAKYLDAIGDHDKQSIENCLNMFKSNVFPLLSKLPSQTIHSDLNEANILVQKSNGKNTITGLIDFGDLVHTCRVFEVSTCMLYLALLKPDDFVKVAGIVLAGYLSEALLTQEEFDVLYECVIGRLTMSLLIGNYQFKVLDPDNEYLMNTSKSGWKVLNTLLKYKSHKQEILRIWLESCDDKAKQFYTI